MKKVIVLAVILTSSFSAQAKSVKVDAKTCYQDICIGDFVTVNDRYPRGQE